MMFAFSAHIFESIWVADSKNMTSFSSSRTKNFLSINCCLTSEKSVNTETFSLFEFTEHRSRYLKKATGFYRKNEECQRIITLFLNIRKTHACRDRNSWVVSLKGSSFSPSKSEGQFNTNIRIDKGANLIGSLCCIRRTPSTPGILFWVGDEFDTFYIDGIWKYINPFWVTSGCDIAISWWKCWSATYPIKMTDPCIYNSIKVFITRQ